MLSAELFSFQNKLNNILDKAAEKAAYEAFMETTQKIGISNIDNLLNEKMKNTAKKFGKKFGEVFAKEVSSDLAKAIMNYIKSSEIMITCMPQALTTIVSPMGPCTGSLMINKSTANIQIL